jgi:Uma2 family endonuclease
MTPTTLDIAGAPGSLALGQWQSATWQEYLWYRNTLEANRFRLFFQKGSLLIADMGWEGIDHATICDLFTLIFGFWFSAHPEQTASSLGRCLLERSNQAAGAPDLVLYLGEDYPKWQPGEPRRIDLNQWRVPDLVGEISDTTLATDLDEKKHLYEALGIPEYWVVDVRGQRVFAFLLRAEDGKYHACEQSQMLAGLPIAVLEQTLSQLQTDSNIQGAQWFNQHIRTLKQQPTE